MAFRQTLTLTDMTALPPAGTRGTRDIKQPGNVRVHGIKLQVLQGQTDALATPAPATRDQIIEAIEEIELAVGTARPRILSAKELYYMHDTEKKVIVNGTLPIDFTNPKCATVLGEELTAWDLFGIPELQIKLKLKMPAAGTFFDVRAQSYIDAMRNTDGAGNFVGRYIRYERWTDFINSGRQSYFGLKKTRPWSRLWLFASNPITRVVLKKNGVEVYDMQNTVNAPELAAQFADYDKAIPHANVFPVLLNADNQINDRMDITPNDVLEMITETATGGNVTFIQEQHSGILV